ncbi:MAG: class I SAM-dependent methyltransferase, partial [Bdellovibrionales bacterium]|nr:class I SAM-dependent methyltransferase [Bdellovibrionales bacterium]NQZ20058.1 class I SAM-dependent methyltransferase [Bdellovibrionales bacterium]
KYLKDLFDEMSQTYGVVNFLSSFGFTSIWRKACLKRTKKLEGRTHIADIMSGMGEVLAITSSHLPQARTVTALDLSTVMCKKINENKPKYPQLEVEILEEDALQSSIPSNSADYLFCSFGLKTLSLDQQNKLAFEVERILKPGGQFSFIEISVPPNPFIRIPLFFYISCIVPWLGWFFLGNPDNYRHLAVYTKAFGNAKDFYKALQKTKLKSDYFTHFFLCASGVSGQKNNSTQLNS